MGEKKRATLCVGLKLSVAPTRKSLMVAELQKFPDFVTAQEGYQRLEGILASRGFTLDGKTKAGQKALQEARKEAGFHAKQRANRWFWVRNKELVNTLSHSITTITTW